MPLPATTVTAPVEAETVVVPLTPLGAIVVEPALADVDDVGKPGATAATPLVVLLLATTVMALAFAADPAAVIEVELVGRPAAIEVTFPPDACTVTAAPTALVVVAATSPSWVNRDVWMDAEAVELATTVASEPPDPAMTVTPPEISKDVMVELASRVVVPVAFNAVLT